MKAVQSTSSTTGYATSSEVTYFEGFGCTGLESDQMNAICASRIYVQGYGILQRSEIGPAMNVLLFIFEVFIFFSMM